MCLSQGPGLMELYIVRKKIYQSNGKLIPEDVNIIVNNVFNNLDENVVITTSDVALEKYYILNANTYLQYLKLFAIQKQNL